MEKKLFYGETDLLSRVGWSGFNRFVLYCFVCLFWGLPNSMILLSTNESNNDNDDDDDNKKK